ncbi:MAG: hypothetical protein R2794_12435 [Chitinophagales bacterium]
MTAYTLLSVALAEAQTNVGEEDVDVVSTYNPVLADAVKTNVEPQVPKNNAKPEEQTYDLPLAFYPIAYQPVLVKPIRISDEKKPDLDNVYVKVGFGTQLTPLAEAYLNSNRSEKYNYGLFGKYISSNGTLENQNYSDLSLGGDAKFFFDDKYALPLHAYYGANTLHYYGYNNEDTTFDKKDIEQKFNKYGFDVAFHNIGDNPLDMNFGLQAGFTGISDINKYHENHPFLRAYAEKELQNKSIVGAAFDYDYFAYVGAGEHYNYLTGVRPYYRMTGDGWSLKAALETRVDKDNNAYILPDATFSYNLIGYKLAFVAGLQSHLQINDFENIVDENPFVKDTLRYVNSAITETWAGFRGSTNGNFSFTIKGYRKNASDLPFYINDSTDEKRFDIVYSDAGIWGGNIELSYFDADRFRFTAALNAFTFSDIAKLDKAYHRPTMEWTFSGMYSFNRKLSANLDVFGIGKSYALLSDGTEPEIPGTIDMNVSATYMYSKYFNIFLNCNNLAAFKYQKYYNYPSYGLQILGGISFSF